MVQLKKLTGARLCIDCKAAPGTVHRLSVCKPCWNRRQIAWKTTAKQRNKELIIKLKSVPCKDCGGAFPHYVMDFDHLPGSKKLGIISEMALRCASEKRILAEAAKCEVVCANCHRIRTFRR